jgi:uncharacterized repeat protein (TIGR03803 family)
MQPPIGAPSAVRLRIAEVARPTLNSNGYKLLYRFKGGSRNGIDPHASLVSVNQILYGTAERGGGSNEGIVFKITLPGKETMLYGFQEKMTVHIRLRA